MESTYKNIIRVSYDLLFASRSSVLQEMQLDVRLCMQDCQISTRKVFPPLCAYALFTVNTFS